MTTWKVGRDMAADGQTGFVDRNKTSLVSSVTVLPPQMNSEGCGSRKDLFTEEQTESISLRSRGEFLCSFRANLSIVKICWWGKSTEHVAPSPVAKGTASLPSYPYLLTMSTSHTII